jgi:hypothetical protein
MESTRAAARAPHAGKSSGCPNRTRPPRRPHVLVFGHGAESAWTNIRSVSDIRWQALSVHILAWGAQECPQHGPMLDVCARQVSRFNGRRRSSPDFQVLQRATQNEKPHGFLRPRSGRRVHGGSANIRRFQIAWSIRIRGLVGVRVEQRQPDFDFMRLTCERTTNHLTQPLDFPTIQADGHATFTLRTHDRETDVFAGAHTCER